MSQTPAIKIIRSADGYREVWILRNSDGTFGFEEFRQYRYAGQTFWEPMSPTLKVFADSPAAAEREARTLVDWLIDQESASD